MRTEFELSIVVVVICIVAVNELATNIKECNLTFTCDVRQSSAEWPFKWFTHSFKLVRLSSNQMVVVMKSIVREDHRASECGKN